MVRRYERSEFGEDQRSHGLEVALTLQKTREACEVGLEPVLLRIFLRGFLEVADHLVDVVLEVGHLTARFHLNRARQVAARHGSCHLGDRANLRG